MKNIIFHIFILTSTLTFSQNIKISGVYKDGNKYLEIFPDSTLEFYTSNNCCLITFLKGYGNYTIKDSIISLTTRDTTLTGNSRYDITGYSDSTNKIEFVIHDDKMNLIPGVSIIAKGKKLTKGGISDQNGKSIMTFDSNVKFIEISYVGYDFEFRIPIEKIIGKKISVTLMPYQILRDKHVDFHIRKTNYETLIVGPYFQKEKGKKRNNSTLTIFRQDIK